MEESTEWRIIKELFHFFSRFLMCLAEKISTCVFILEWVCNVMFCYACCLHRGIVSLVWFLMMSNLSDIEQGKMTLKWLSTECFTGENPNSIEFWHLQNFWSRCGWCWHFVPIFTAPFLGLINLQLAQTKAWGCSGGSFGWMIVTKKVKSIGKNMQLSG